MLSNTHSSSNQFKPAWVAWVFSSSDTLDVSYAHISVSSKSSTTFKCIREIRIYIKNGTFVIKLEQKIVHSGIRSQNSNTQWFIFCTQSLTRMKHIINWYVVYQIRLLVISLYEVDIDFSYTTLHICFKLRQVCHFSRP